MGIVYDPAPDEVNDLVGQVIGKFHSELSDAEVTVAVLMASAGESQDSSEAVLKLHGYPCAATISITPYKWRVLKVPDAIMSIDVATWAAISEDERVALIDHELFHLELAKDKDGHIRSDDQGRPVLRIKLHDFELGGFAVIAARHGRNALEAQAFHAVARAFRQQLFSWAGAGAGEDDDGPSHDLRVVPAFAMGT